MSSIIFVGIGGFFGAILRYVIEQSFKKMSLFPYGTLVVNVIGSFLLGCLLGVTIHHYVYLLVSIGFLGSFTTFSTLTFDSIKLYKNKQWFPLTIYITLTYIGGLSAALIGMLLFI